MTIQPTSFRLPSELLKRVADYAARLEEETGIPVGRSVAVAKLLTAALNAEDSRTGTGRTKRPSSRATRR